MICYRAIVYTVTLINVAKAVQTVIFECIDIKGYKNTRTTLVSHSASALLWIILFYKPLPRCIFHQGAQGTASVAVSPRFFVQLADRNDLSSDVIIDLLNFLTSLSLSLFYENWV